MVVYSRIAWSRNGLLAYIDSDHKVFVTWLRCIEGSRWEYVDSVPVPLPHEGKPIHLSWSANSYDLAISDELGRLHIISIGVSGIPTSQIIASSVRDQRIRPAELDRLVGVQWLKTPQNNAQQSEHTQSTEFCEFEPISPMKQFVPLKKRNSLVAVNGNGMLRYLLQSTDFRYSEVDELIPGISQVTAATFIQRSDSSVLVVLVAGTTLSVYNASLNQEPMQVTLQDIASIKLPTQKEELFTLVAAQEPNHPVVIKCVYPSQIVSFTLVESQESLHHSFFELFNASDPVPPDPFKTWHFLGEEKTAFDIPLRHCILSQNMALMLFEDGKIQTECIVGEESYLQLDKVGLTFGSGELKDAESLSLSPNGTCIAYFKSEKLELSGCNIRQECTSEQAQQIGTALARSLSNCGESFDDILKVCYDILHNTLMGINSSVFFTTLATEAQKKLEVSLITPEDQMASERFMLVPSKIQLWLSFLSALGTSQNWVKTSGSSVCFTLMHHHLLSFAITWTMRRLSQKPRAQNFEQLQLEIQASQYHLTIMFGPIRWATDLLARISQELFTISTTENPMDRLMSKPNIYVSLLLSSVSRYMIRYSFKAIKMLTTAAKGLSEQEQRINSKISATLQATNDAKILTEAKARLSSPSNYQATRAYKKLGIQLQSLPVKLEVFEKFLFTLEEKHKALATGMQMTEETRLMLEYELIRTARIPQKLAPLAKVSLDLSTQLFKTLDVPTLYFYDTTWLGLDAVSCDEEIDGIRKRVIMPQESTQVCSRCNIKSTYGPDSGKQTTYWQSVFCRYCICGGAWLRQEEK